MPVQSKEVMLYVTKAGNCPLSEWLRDLKDSKTRAKIRVRIDRMVLGNFGDCKSVGHGVSELRIDYGPGYRIYFGLEGERIVVLLCGGEKHSQDKDIARARTYWSDYRSREHEQS